MVFTPVDNAHFSEGLAYFFGDADVLPAGATHREVVEIGTWNTRYVTSMQGAFLNRETFNSDISGWDTRSVTDMSFMFSGATSFNQPIGNWQTSKVSSFWSMFLSAHSFNQSLDGWDTSSATTMQSMFKDAVVFNHSVNHFVMSNVTHVIEMFNRARKFNQPLNNWDMSKCRNLQYMFILADSFNQDIRAWRVPADAKVTSMFGGCPFTLEENFGDTTELTFVNGHYQPTVNFWFKYDENGNVIDNTPSRTVHITTDANFILSINWYFDETQTPPSGTSRTALRLIGNWDTSNVTNMNNAFLGRKTFNEDISNWDTSNVTSMQYMFASAEAFDQNIGQWNVSNVKSFKFMFNSAKVFNQNLNNWDVSAATDFSSMFRLAQKFNGDISNWNTVSATKMNGMLEAATSFNTYIGAWNTGNVTTFQTMFKNAQVFNQDIGNWNTSKCANMAYMFNRAYAFNQDISNWDTSNVQNMLSMFHDARVFNQNIGGWNVSKVTNFQSFAWGALAFDRDIRGWDVLGNAKFISMFTPTSPFIAIYGGEPGVVAQTNASGVITGYGLSPSFFTGVPDTVNPQQVEVPTHAILSDDGYTFPLFVEAPTSVNVEPYVADGVTYYAPVGELTSGSPSTSGDYEIVDIRTIYAALADDGYHYPLYTRMPEDIPSQSYWYNGTLYYMPDADVNHGMQLTLPGATIVDVRTVHVVRASDGYYYPLYTFGPSDIPSTTYTFDGVTYSMPTADQNIAVSSAPEGYSVTDVRVIGVYEEVQGNVESLSSDFADLVNSGLAYVDSKNRVVFTDAFTSTAFGTSVNTTKASDRSNARKAAVSTAMRRYAQSIAGRATLINASSMLAPPSVTSKVSLLRVLSSGPVRLSELDSSVGFYAPMDTDGDTVELVTLYGSTINIMRTGDTYTVTLSSRDSEVVSVNSVSAGYSTEFDEVTFIIGSVLGVWVGPKPINPGFKVGSTTLWAINGQTDSRRYSRTVIPTSAAAGPQLEITSVVNNNVIRAPISVTYTQDVSFGTPGEFMWWDYTWESAPGGTGPSNMPTNFFSTLPSTDVSFTEVVGYAGGAGWANVGLYDHSVSLPYNQAMWANQAFRAGGTSGSNSPYIDFRQFYDPTSALLDYSTLGASGETISLPFNNASNTQKFWANQTFSGTIGRVLKYFTLHVVMPYTNDILNQTGVSSTIYQYSLQLLDAAGSTINPDSDTGTTGNGYWVFHNESLAGSTYGPYIGQMTVGGIGYKGSYDITSGLPAGINFYRIVHPSAASSGAQTQLQISIGLPSNLALSVSSFEIVFWKK